MVLPINSLLPPQLILNARLKYLVQDKMMEMRETSAANPVPPDGETWELRLYVAGQTVKSITALANLKRYCEQHLAGRYSLEVIDLLKNPQLAEGDQILAIPTLVRKVPEPIRKIIGDLSNEERVLVGLDVRPALRD